MGLVGGPPDAAFMALTICDGLASGNSAERAAARAATNAAENDVPLPVIGSPLLSEQNGMSTPGVQTPPSTALVKYAALLLDRVPER